MKISISLSFSLGLLLLLAKLDRGSAFVSAVPKPRATRFQLSYQNDRTTISDIDANLINDGSLETPILKRAGNDLVASNLIYLLADLRMLSYCGYTVTSFDELDGCNKKDAEFRPLTPFKFLQLILHELVGLVGRQMHADNEAQKKDWLSNARLLQLLRYVLDLDVSSVEAEDREVFLSTAADVKKQGLVQDFARALNQQVGIDSDNPEVVKQLFEWYGQNIFSKIWGAISKGAKGQNMSPLPTLAGEKEPSWKKVFDISKEAERERDLLLREGTWARQDRAEWIDEQVDRENLVAPLLDGFSDLCLKEHSYFSKIFEDDIKLVLFNDRYQHLKCVFGITVNEKQKKVTVIFRGTVSRDDWRNNFKVVQEQVPNPVAKDLTSADVQEEKIGVHKGFFNYLRRKRLDDDKVGFERRFDHIMREVQKYMKDDWRLCVTGHSMGGALATLFSFYAAAETNVTETGKPVELYTFASPLVGDKSFRKAFKCLEENKKIVHARFCNNGDFDKCWWKFLNYAGYQHVGVQIHLFPSTSKKPANVFYHLNEAWTSRAKRNLSNFKKWITHAPKLVWPRWAVQAHKLTEYEERMTEIDSNVEIKKKGLDQSLEAYYREHVWN